jgi:hypothetical protein
MAANMGSNLDENTRELQMNKMKYCMHKDDLAIGLGRPMYTGSVSACSRKHAYPSVISTLKGNTGEMMRWMAVTNFMVTGQQTAHEMKEWFVRGLKSNPKLGMDPQASLVQQVFCDMSAEKKDRLIYTISNSLELYFVGVSLGLAYAHQCSGDTVASVMVGGLKTVLNGEFQVHTNDLLMFYWDDEYGFFEEDGSRKNRLEYQTNGNPNMGTVATYVRKGETPAPPMKEKFNTMDRFKKRKVFHEQGQWDPHCYPL